jgi:molybdopterin/thiamine biosynthesis adenylyltransferase
MDGDSFEDSNLNRQILSSCVNIDEPKVDSAKQRAAIVNPAVEIKVFSTNANEKNLPRRIEGCNAVVEAIDDIRLRFTLEKVCKKMRIPFVHGAIAGFLGQITTIYPDDKGLESLYSYSKSSRSGIEKRLGTPCVTPMWIGSWQALEAIKIVLGWGNTLRNRILFFDLENQLIRISEIH